MTERSREPVELLGVHAAASASNQDLVVTREPRPLLLLVGVVIGCMALVAGLVSAGNSQEEAEDENSSAPAPETAEIERTERTLEAGGLSAGRSVGAEFVPWPDPPRDHDPHVLGYPGSGQQLLGRVTNTVLVYVNSIGRPTVIDVDSGSILEVDVADGRPYDQFSVEPGGIVSFGVPRENAELATARAITFHVHAAAGRQLTVGKDPTQTVERRPGPVLCRTTEPCEGLQWSASSFSNGLDSAERRARDADEGLIGLLSEDLPIQGRFLLVDVGETATQRIPVPAGADVWVINFSSPAGSD